MTTKINTRLAGFFGAPGDIRFLGDISKGSLAYRNGSPASPENDPALSRPLSQECFFYGADVAAEGMFAQVLSDRVNLGGSSVPLPWVDPSRHVLVLTQHDNGGGKEALAPRDTSKFRYPTIKIDNAAGGEIFPDDTDNLPKASNPQGYWWQIIEPKPLRLLPDLRSTVGGGGATRYHFIKPQKWPTRIARDIAKREIISASHSGGQVIFEVDDGGFTSVNYQSGDFVAIADADFANTDPGKSQERFWVPRGAKIFMVDTATKAGSTITVLCTPFYGTDTRGLSLGGGGSLQRLTEVEGLWNAFGDSTIGSIFGQGVTPPAGDPYAENVLDHIKVKGLISPSDAPAAYRTPASWVYDNKGRAEPGYGVTLFPAGLPSAGPDLAKPIYDLRGIILDPAIDPAEQWARINYEDGVLELSHPIAVGSDLNPLGMSFNGQAIVYAAFVARNPEYYEATGEGGAGLTSIAPGPPAAPGLGIARIRLADPSKGEPIDKAEGWVIEPPGRSKRDLFPYTPSNASSALGKASFGSLAGGLGFSWSVQAVNPNNNLLSLGSFQYKAHSTQPAFEFWPDAEISGVFDTSGKVGVRIYKISSESIGIGFLKEGGNAGSLYWSNLDKNLIYSGSNIRLQTGENLKDAFQYLHQTKGTQTGNAFTSPSLGSLPSGSTFVGMQTSYGIGDALVAGKIDETSYTGGFEGMCADGDGSFYALEKRGTDFWVHKGTIANNFFTAGNPNLNFHESFQIQYGFPGARLISYDADGHYLCATVADASYHNTKVYHIGLGGADSMLVAGIIDTPETSGGKIVSASTRGKYLTLLVETGTSSYDVFIETYEKDTHIHLNTFQIMWGNTSPLVGAAHKFTSNPSHFCLLSKHANTNTITCTIGSFSLGGMSSNSVDIISTDRVIPNVFMDDCHVYMGAIGGVGLGYDDGDTLKEGQILYFSLTSFLSYSGSHKPYGLVNLGSDSSTNPVSGTFEVYTITGDHKNLYVWAEWNGIYCYLTIDKISQRLVSVMNLNNNVVARHSQSDGLYYYAFVENLDPPTSKGLYVFATGYKGGLWIKDEDVTAPTYTVKNPLSF